VIALVLSSLLAGAPPALPPAPKVPAAAPATSGQGGVKRGRPELPPPRLAEMLLDAVAELHLEELRDAGPSEGRCPGDPTCPWPLPRAAAVTHLDLAVIRLDAKGRVVEAANVQVDPSAPAGRVVKLDQNLAAADVRFRRWNTDRREAGPIGAPFLEADDLAPSRRHGTDFMVPYPASLFKLLLAFHVERRAALGVLDLGRPVLDVPGPPLPGEMPAWPERRPLGEWVERMITESDNRATKAVIHHLHDRGEIDILNRDLSALGLDTLRVEGTSPYDGGRWAPGEINVTAMDAARLLWLVAGSSGLMWRTPVGAPVTRAVLPEPARERLQFLLADQAFHDTLSSGSVCGGGPMGIPAQVPLRFVDQATGFETAGEQRWRHDVRPCLDSAEVRFLHKTGLTWNYAADAGIVESLPGKPFRRYVVAMISTAGTRYLDPEDAAVPHHPCDEQQACVTRKLAQLGAAIDAHAVRAAAHDRRRR
jgi:hypothetical protein